MKKISVEKKDERGSYTIEATISLVAFMIAVMFIYLQIRTMVCENIMQNAVSNLALEMSTYSYVLDKAGFIAEHASDELETMNAAVSAGETLVSDAGAVYQSVSEMVSDFPNKIGDFASVIGSLYNDGAGGISDTLRTLAQSLGNINVSEGKTLVRNTVETAIKTAVNAILSDFYLYRLNTYLPAERSAFCKSYWVDEGSVSFRDSRFFPDKDNNSVAVIVTYRTVTPYQSLPIGSRTVTKCAYTAAWVESNTNKP